MAGEHPARKGLQFQQFQSKGACAVGCGGDETSTGQWSTSHQKDGQAQRHRSLGNDAKIRRVEAVSAEVVRWLLACEQNHNCC